MRRDKLNSYISELAKMVPTITNSSKKLDKASVLRLTASYLRTYHTLLKSKQLQNDLPVMDQVILEQLVTNELSGFLLLLTTKGKIIFVSHNIEQLLGHYQTEMLGQSVLNFIRPEDHDKFKGHLVSDLISNENWRRYFQVGFTRAPVTRTESVTYEVVNVMGVSKAPNNHKFNRDTLQNDNNFSDLLIFFVSLQKPAPLIDRLIEASKDEYVTQHLLDARIVNCDQRISFVSGYMIEEVTGLSAFKFMHRNDVRWTMIALRQMYDKGESIGTSCYRLLSRSGRFIYLKTRGYLEVDKKGTVQSFICVNTLVSEQEGRKLIKEMKTRYSAMVVPASSNKESQTVSKGLMAVASVEDPHKLDIAIKHLLADLPSPINRCDSSSTSSGSPTLSINSHINELVSPKCQRVDDELLYYRPRIKRPIVNSSQSSDELYSSSSSPYCSSVDSLKRFKLSPETCCRLDTNDTDDDNDVNDDDDNYVGDDYCSKEDNKHFLEKLLKKNGVITEIHQSQHIKCE